MIEGLIVFILGFICGAYKDKVINFLQEKFCENKKEIIIND